MPNVASLNISRITVCLLVCITGCTSLTRRTETASSTEPRKSQQALSTEQQALKLQLAMARSLEQEKDFEKASQIYQNIIKQHPKCVVAVHRLAITYDQQKRFEESEKLFKRALQLQPNDSNILCDLGHSQYLQRRWADAEENLQKAIKLNPEHQRSHNQLGMVYARTDRTDRAMSEFRAGGCTASQAHINCGIGMILDGKPAQARQELQVAGQSQNLSEDLRGRLDKLNQMLASADKTEQPGRDSAGSLDFHLVSATQK